MPKCRLINNGKKAQLITLFIDRDRAREMLKGWNSGDCIFNDDSKESLEHLLKQMDEEECLVMVVPRICFSCSHIADRIGSAIMYP